MLRRAGADVGRAAAALTASTLMQIATRLTLPLFAIPAIIGGAPVSHSLVTSAYLSLLVLLLLDVAGILAFASDPPLLLTGRGLQWALNRTIRRRRKVTALPQRAPRRARLCPSHDRRAFEDSPADGCHEYGLRLHRPALRASSGRRSAASLTRAPGVRRNAGRWRELGWRKCGGRSGSTAPSRSPSESQSSSGPASACSPSRSCSGLTRPRPASSAWAP
jgi:hypothetical protein